MRIALGDVHVGRDAHQLRAFDFHEAELPRVVHDVGQRAEVAHVGLEPDEARLLQQQQAAALVDRVVGDAHLAAGGHVLHLLVLQRIQAHVGQDAGARARELETLLPDRVGEKGLVLEIVDVDVARVQRHVRRRPVGELDHLDLQALGPGFFCGHVHGVRVGARHHADAQAVGREREGERTQAQGRSGGGGEQAAAGNGCGHSSVLGQVMRPFSGPAPPHGNEDLRTSLCVFFPRTRRRRRPAAVVPSAALDGAGRIAAPLAPAAREQRGPAQPGDLHGQHVGRGAHAAAALVHHGGRITARQQRFEFGPQLRGRLEAAVGPEVVGERAVQRAGNVAGNRIERLHLAAIARGRACIDHRLAWPAQGGLDLGGRGQPLQGLAQGEVRLEVRGLLAVCEFAAGLLPRLQSAVEHRHGLVACPLQHPPQAPAEVGAVAVVHHRLHRIGKAHRGEPGRETLGVGQGVAAAGHRHVPLRRHDRATRAGRTVPGAERFVEVRVHRSGDVRFEVLLVPARRMRQIEAAVEDHQGGAARAQRLEFVGGNEGGVGHGVFSRWNVREWEAGVPGGCGREGSHGADCAACGARPASAQTANRVARPSACRRRAPCPVPRAGSVLFRRRPGCRPRAQYGGDDPAHDDQRHAGPADGWNVVAEQHHAVHPREHDSGILQVGDHQRAALRAGPRIGARHAELARGGQEADGQQPQAGPARPRRGAREQHGRAARHGRAHREIEHRACLRLADARQCHHLHVGEGGGQARQQPDQAGEHLVGTNAGAQHHDHACETGHHRHHQRRLQGRARAARAARGPPRQQGTADDEGGDPHAAHVVERHGGGERQVRDGVEPCAERDHADQTAPGMHARVAGAQPHALAPRQRPENGHADDAPIAHQFSRVEIGRCQLHADPHAREEECGEDHPEGLHGRGAEDEGRVRESRRC